MTDLETIKERVQVYHKRAMRLNSEVRTSLEREYLNGQIELCQRLLIEILSLGETKMLNVGENELVSKVVKLGDIKTQVHKNDLEDHILSWCNELTNKVNLAKMRGDDIPAFQINPKRIKYTNLAAYLSRMKKANRLDLSFIVTKRKEEFYLVKKV